jgi:hypothetical protein
MTGMSGGDAAVGSNSMVAFAWLRASSIKSVAGTEMSVSRAARSECECAVEVRSSGMVWQSCGVVCDPVRSVDLFAGFLQRPASQQCPLLPGNMKNCEQDMHPPQR